MAAAGAAGLVGQHLGGGAEAGADGEADRVGVHVSVVGEVVSADARVVCAAGVNAEAVVGLAADVRVTAASRVVPAPAVQGGELGAGGSGAAISDTATRVARLGDGDVDVGAAADGVGGGVRDARGVLARGRAAIDGLVGGASSDQMAVGAQLSSPDPLGVVGAAGAAGLKEKEKHCLGESLQRGTHSSGSKSISAQG